MYILCFHVCSRTVKEKSGDDARRQRLQVLHLIRMYQRPQLWRKVSRLILDDGQLDVSTVLTPDNINDLVYVLSIDEAAEEITKLK